MEPAAQQRDDVRDAAGRWGTRRAAMEPAAQQRDDAPSAVFGGPAIWPQWSPLLNSGTTSRSLMTIRCTGCCRNGARCSTAGRPGAVAVVACRPRSAAMEPAAQQRDDPGTPPAAATRTRRRNGARCSTAGRPRGHRGGRDAAGRRNGARCSTAGRPANQGANIVGIAQPQWSPLLNSGPT